MTEYRGQVVTTLSAPKIRGGHLFKWYCSEKDWNFEEPMASFILGPDAYTGNAPAECTMGDLYLKSRSANMTP